MTLAKGVLVLGLAFSVAACSGGGGGGGGASSNRKGTGYLKVELPQMSAGSAVVMPSLKPMGLPWAGSSSPGGTAVQLKQMITNTNQGTDCVGIVESIPFLVCMVESLGINEPGTYAGNLGPLSLEAVVTELTADPDGYDIQAIVKKSGTEIFSYKANTAGTKGEIKYAIYEFAAVLGSWGDPAEVLDRRNIIKWDSTNSANGVVEATEEWHSDYMSGGTITKTVSYMKAFIDEDNGIADIVRKQSTHGFYSAIPEARLRTTIYQTRIKGSHLIEAFAICDHGGAASGDVAVGTDCWDFSVNTGLDDPSEPERNWRMGNPAELGFSGAAQGALVGGTWSDSAGFTLIESKTLTPDVAVGGDAIQNLIDGSQTWSAPAFVDTNLADVVAATRLGSFVFITAVGTDWGSGAPAAGSIPALVKDVQAVSFATMDALISGK